MSTLRTHIRSRVARYCLAAALSLVVAGACDEGLEGVDPGSIGSSTFRFYNFVLPDTEGRR